MEAFLLKLLIFLGAATIAVPLARKFKLGSVLGYLIAGIAIGPFGLALIDNIEAIMHFTEFGVVMMLFLVGLELKPSLLWQMRTPILGMGCNFRYRRLVRQRYRVRQSRQTRRRLCCPGHRASRCPGHRC